MKMCALFDPIEPYRSDFLQVSQIHRIYYEESGNKNGIPAVFLHGGPGTGCTPRARQFFDPKVYRIILFDQRGSGKSTPSFCTEDNDTWSLIDDMEKLRKHLGVEKWVVLGGSWGSFLALLYAETHIDRVLALIMHGIFTFRQEELDWMFQDGASSIYSDYWDEYASAIPEDERGDFFTAYYKRFQSDNEEERIKAVKWIKFELSITRLRVNHDKFKLLEEDPDLLLKGALFECYYFAKKGFLHSPNQILDDAHIIRNSGIPVTIIQGRYDMVAPFKTAWELYKKLPSSDFVIVEDAGHSASEEGITKGVVEACNKYARLHQK